LAKVSRADVLDWANALAAKGHSASTVRHAVGALQGLLRHAVELGALQASPLDRLRLPAPKPAKVKALTVEEVEALAEAIATPVLRPAGHGAGYPAHRLERPDLALWVRLGAYCGLRAGEVLALRRESVDLERKVLVVDRSVSEVGGKLHLGSTKTARSRSVPVIESVMADLRDHLDHRVGPNPDALLFISEAGGPVSHSNWYRRHFKPALARAGLPEDTRYHDLRHTYAALLIAAGGHPRAIMERLGHSSITVTLGTYGHLFPSLDEALTTRLEGSVSKVRARPREREPATIGTRLAHDPEPASQRTKKRPS
jgi:integrase